MSGARLAVDEAGALLARARRIMVIGNSGAGKSTLSRQIADRLDLPYVSHDRDIRWLPGWQVRDRAEQRRLTEAFAAAPAWVMDGTNVSTFDLRAPRADLVIWLRPSRVRALWQLAGRVLRNHGRVRPDMAEGCPEPLPDRAFLAWIWTFEARQSPRIEAALEHFAPEVPVVILRTRAEARHLLEAAGMPG